MQLPRLSLEQHSDLAKGCFAAPARAYQTQGEKIQVKATIAESCLSLTVSTEITCTIEALLELAKVRKLTLPCASHSGPVSSINISQIFLSAKVIPCFQVCPWKQVGGEVDAVHLTLLLSARWAMAQSLGAVWRCHSIKNVMWFCYSGWVLASCSQQCSSVMHSEHQCATWVQHVGVALSAASTSTEKNQSPWRWKASAESRMLCSVYRPHCTPILFSLLRFQLKIKSFQGLFFISHTSPELQHLLKGCALAPHPGKPLPRWEAQLVRAHRRQHIRAQRRRGQVRHLLCAQALCTEWASSCKHTSSHSPAMAKGLALKWEASWARRGLQEMFFKDQGAVIRLLNSREPFRVFSEILFQKIKLKPRLFPKGKMA